MSKRFFLFLLFASMMMPKLKAQHSSQLDLSRKNASGIIFDGAKLQLISSQFGFTEGPAVDKKGNVFFTDQPNNAIWEYDIHGKLSLFLKNTGRSNGMYFDNQGNLITCADEKNQIWLIQPNKKIKVLVDNFKGLHFNGPNDLWISPSNKIYFTDPYYQRDYWTRTSPEIEGQKVYYMDATHQPVVVADNLVQPNGIIGTADGKYLYVADIGANKTYRYQIGDDGKLFDQKLFVTLGSDGMTIDERGNLYLTGQGVSIFNAEGKLIEHIDVPEEWTSNVVFGGKEKNILFITASKSVYTIQMKVKAAH